MNSKDNRILRRRKRKLARRLERKQYEDQPRPMLAARSIRYEMSERALAILDVDGVVAPTTGERKEGMGLSYKGVCLRGDTDFALTRHFDRWTEDGVRFAFGIDAMPKLVGIAESLDNAAWKPLGRCPKRKPDGPQRTRPENVKQRIVEQKGYKDIRLESEWVAEFRYRPGKCRRAYRVVVVKKDLSIRQGQQMLFSDNRYFFYITNLEEMPAAELVFFCNERCNQENLIDQLKNGLNALRMPVGDLVSNWAYMVMAALAWTLKAWFALQARRGADRAKLLRMEFRRFLSYLVRVPCQIVKTGRRIVYRILGYNGWTRTFLHTFGRIRAVSFT